MTAQQGDILVATEAAQFDIGGELFTIAIGTTVRAGHPLHLRHPAYFKVLTPDYEFIQPDNRGPVNPSRADQRGARTR